MPWPKRARKIDFTMLAKSATPIVNYGCKALHLERWQAAAKPLVRSYATNDFV